MRAPSERRRTRRGASYRRAAAGGRGLHDRPQRRDFDYNQPLIRKGPNDYILLRNGQKKLVRSLQGGEHRLTKLGKGFFRDKYYEYLVHVPVIIRGRRRSGRSGLQAQGLAAGEQAGRRNEAPGAPHGGAGGAAGQATSGGLARPAPAPRTTSAAPRLSLVPQMNSILPERLPALVRPAFDLVLRGV